LAPRGGEGVVVDIGRVVTDPNEALVGLYADGHQDKAEFLKAALAVWPDAAVRGWTRKSDPTAASKTVWYEEFSRPPEETEVVHTHWRMRSGFFARARAGTRGSFPVTYLRLKSEDGALDIPLEAPEPVHWSGVISCEEGGFVDLADSSPGAFRYLHLAGIRTLDELASLTRGGLLKLPGVGKTRLGTIEAYLSAKGVALRADPAKRCPYCGDDSEPQDLNHLAHICWMARTLSHELTKEADLMGRAVWYGNRWREEARTYRVSLKVLVLQAGGTLNIPAAEMARAADTKLEVERRLDGVHYRVVSAPGREEGAT
jgi:hypothetical protein